MDTSGHMSLCEDYVSFETAKLLKEKGFKHWCYKCYGDAVYHNGTPISFDEECDLKSAGLEDEIEYVEGGYLYDFGCDNRKEDAKVWAAPTIQMAMKWLREEKGIAVIPVLSSVLDNEKFLWDVKIVVAKTNDSYSQGWVYETQESACETAIEYCLENLI